MIQLLFGTFHAATLSMGADGGLLLSGAHERVLSWGIVFCVLAAAMLVLWLLQIRRRTVLAAFLVSLLIPLVVMPAVRREHIHVLPERIVIDSGGWLPASRTVIELKDIRQIREHQTQFNLGGYIVEPNALWYLDYRDGSTQPLLLNGFFTAHRAVIAQYLRDRGHIVL